MKPLRTRVAELIPEGAIGRVAHEAGLHRSNLSAWLHGRRRITVDQLERVLAVLGVRIDLTRDP